MTPAPMPADEDERLAALRELLLLDTPPEERFDRLARFAAEQLDTPIALLTLVDGQRQWFKSRMGLEATETPREISFCGHPEERAVCGRGRQPRPALCRQPAGDR